MRIGSGIGKVIDTFRSGAVVADLTQVGALVAGAFGVTTVGAPIVVCGAVAIAAIAGVGIYRDWKSGEQLDRLPDIEKWIADQARRKGAENRSLEEVLIYALADPEVLAGLPQGVTKEPLAALLAIIRAEGKDRERLILEQATMVESLNQFLHAEFAAIKDRFDLQDTDLALIRRDLRKANSTAEFLEWMLLDREAPPLHIPHEALDENTRFLYSARRVVIRGRESEMDELAAFLDCDDKFKWSAWTGLAGMGKSRLALEFCNRAAEADWEVGFYNWKVTREVAWDKWQPDLPTLIVFDYVQEHAEAIRKAIGLLAEGAEGLGRKVRFLLLERPAPDKSGFSAGSWWMTLLDKGHEGDTTKIAASCHDHEGDKRDGPPRTRPLEGLEPGPVREILAELAEKEGKHLTEAQLDEQLAQLERVSPLRRPLYVALLAEAIESGKMQTYWNAEDLTRFVLEKEQGRWELALTAAGITGNDQELWFNLFLLATMCGGLEIPEGERGVFGDDTLDDWLPTRKQHGNGASLAVFAHGATGRKLPRLEPDMLGELFVLEAMQGWDSRDTDFRSAAWHHDPEGFAEFLIRAVNSFPQHPTLDKLLAVPVDAADLSGYRPWLLIVPWALRADRLLEIEDTPGKIAAVNAVLGLLRPYVKANPEDTEARRGLAVGLTNAIAHSGKDTARADGLLGELRELGKDHPEEAAVRENLAKGLNNAIGHSGKDTARADGLLGELRELVETHPEDAAVRENLASGLTNAIGDSGKDTARADGLLGELRELAKAHPEDAAVRERLAKGLYNAIFHSGKDTARAAGLLGELRELVETHPEDAAVREQLASGLYNAFNNSEANSPRADGLLGELRELVKDHPEEAALREPLAKGLNNAIGDSGSDLDRATKMLGELRELVETHPEEAALREQLARAYGASILHATAAGDAARAAEMAEGLVPLREAVHSQPGMMDLFKEVFEAALGLAIEQGNTDAEQRLRAASKALFGE